MITASGSHSSMHSEPAFAERTAHNISTTTVGLLIIIYQRVEGMREAISTPWMGAGPRARLRYALG